MIRDSCVANEQCTWGGHHGLCTGHVCTCQEGYIAAYSRCYQGNSSWLKKKHYEDMYIEDMYI